MARGEGRCSGGDAAQPMLVHRIIEFGERPACLHFDERGRAKAARDDIDFTHRRADARADDGLEVDGVIVVGQIRFGESAVHERDDELAGSSARADGADSDAREGHRRFKRMLHCNPQVSCGPHRTDVSGTFRHVQLSARPRKNNSLFVTTCNTGRMVWQNSAIPQLISCN